MINQQTLDELYTLYGFKKDKDTADAVVYLFNEGYFHNAEIVLKKEDNKNIDALKSEYSELDYAVKVSTHKDIDSAHEKLFDGFFRIQESNQRLKGEYDNFCQQQTKRLGGNTYTYIESRYFINNEPKEHSIIDTLTSLFLENTNEPSLIILEAPAGFGKTCTSYEVISQLSDKYTKGVPIIAELSKNRKAPMFHYVLLSEIDRKFTTLSSKLVKTEIRNGRIPLIIDGFDELLSKSINNETIENEEIQTMLDTIATLLSDGSIAKILLTSRKSSIFTGDVFSQWVDLHLSECTIVRVQLCEPTIQDWIGHEKIEKLKSNKINLDNLLNPVLLTILRNSPIDKFDREFTNINNIITEYFDGLLTRERERQQLLLEVKDQYDVMRKLSGMMVQFDITAEDPQFIKDMLLHILSPNISTYINRYREQLDEMPIPTKDEFAMKLVHHALLDRKSFTNNKIGFINEFVFGILIAESILAKDITENDIPSEEFVDFATTAFAVKDEGDRLNLFAALKTIISCMPYEKQLDIDLILVKRLTQTYENLYLKSVHFNIDLNGQYKFLNCTFVSCTFENKVLDIDIFEKCQFFDCKFYKVAIVAQSPKNQQLVFSNCIGHEEFQQAAVSIQEQAIVINDELKYKRIVLEHYWKPGAEKAMSTRRSIDTLFRGVAPHEKEDIALAIDSLLKDEIIQQKAHCIELNLSLNEDIRRILGRL
ncbi:MAG: hypothetical protein MdMp014T_2036 [Treponematales bacterium]